MKKYALVIAVVLVLSFIPTFTPAPASAATGPSIFVKSEYIVARYGYAIINETITYKNNLTSPVAVPDIQLGFTRNITSHISQYNITGSGYTVSASTNGNQSVYIVSGGGRSLSPGQTSSFSFKALLSSIVEQTQPNLRIEVLLRPFINMEVTTLNMVIKMPASTELTSKPADFAESSTGMNVTYYASLKNTGPVAASSVIASVLSSSQTDFHPLKVYSATRVVSVSSSGDPVVEDTLRLRNDGLTPLSTLVVNPLTSPNAVVTVIPSSEPPLLNPVSLSLQNYGIDLSSSALQLSVGPGSNFSLTYTYPLPAKYYTVSGAGVTVKLPVSPPIQAIVDSYTIAMRVSPGVKAVITTPETFTKASVFSTGTVRFVYTLSIGWALERGVPVSILIFIVALVGLFIVKPEIGETEEKAEETPTERVSLMIRAFEEKTGFINGMFDEVVSASPGTVNKALFDDLRNTLDSLRSKALQRLNEAKQKSTTVTFFDLLSKINATEREVDRAAKDIINIYEQYYTKRMRKEVFDKLLPSYKKRLEKSLDQLSDELNLAQREAKLL